MARQPSFSKVLSHVSMDNPIGSKHHYFDLPTHVKSEDTILLVLRNYKECIVRQAFPNVNHPISQDRYKDIEGELNRFIQMIIWVSQQKIKVFYYGDLITDFLPTVMNLTQSLDLYSEEKWTKFLNIKDELLQSGVNLYDTLFISTTKGKAVSFHQNRIPDTNFWNLIDTRIRDLPDKARIYLEKYLT